MSQADLKSPFTSESSSCPNCGAPDQNTDQSWCRKCGYYGLLGTCVELDEDWEKITQTSEEPEESQPKSHIEIFVGSVQHVPNWFWHLSLATIGVVGLSVAGTFITGYNTPERTAWSVSQAFACLMLVIIAHFWAYLVACAKDETMGILDFACKPLAVWLPTLKDMPKSQSRTYMGVCGSAGLLGAIFILGGIPWAALFPFQVHEKADTNLVQAIADSARTDEVPDENLEESIESFVSKGSQGLEDTKPKSKDDVVRNETTDCLVLGYTTNPRDENDFSTLVIAAMRNGDLKVVGRVAEGISSETRQFLNERMREIPANYPAVQTDVTANWVKPVITCRVDHAGWSHGQLKKPKFEKLLAEVK